MSKTFPTREQAQRWHDDNLSKTRTVVPEAPHTLATWTAAWLPDSHLTPGAQRYTRERLRLHVFPVLGRTLLTEIRPTQLNRLYRNLRKVTGGELSHATVVRLHGVLSQVLRAAVEGQSRGIRRFICGNVRDDLARRPFASGRLRN